MTPDARGWGNACAPDLDTVDALARDAFAKLPDVFRTLCGDVTLHVSEVADEDMLRALNIHDPLELTGLYEGVSLADGGANDPPPGGAHVFLFRMPILFEWAVRGDATLGALVTHILVHEIGHHFGLSDADMDAIEAASETS